jgi:hypothetical protein
MRHVGGSLCEPLHRDTCHSRGMHRADRQPVTGGKRTTAEDRALALVSPVASFFRSRSTVTVVTGSVPRQRLPQSGEPASECTASGSRNSESHHGGRGLRLYPSPGHLLPSLTSNYRSGARHRSGARLSRRRRNRDGFAKLKSGREFENQEQGRPSDSPLSEGRRRRVAQARRGRADCRVAVHQRALFVREPP